MEKVKQRLTNIEQWLDKKGESLKQKEVRVPTELMGAILFLVAAVVLLLIMPSQVTVKEAEVVSGRVFPTYLFGLIIAGSAIIIIKECIKLIHKEPLTTITLNMLTEVKALIIFCILLIFYFVSSLTGAFVVGAVVCALCFLLYFRCKKPSYYAITLVFAVGIWAAFRFILNVRF